MRLSGVLLLILLGNLSWAQTPDGELSAGFMANRPTIDGQIEDQVEWRNASSAAGFLDIATGQPEPFSTRFWIGYDNEFIFFAVRADDAQPNLIIARETRSNVSVEGNDNATLTLDALGTLTDFNRFSVNAAGAYSIDISGGRAQKAEWLGQLVAKGRVTATGWEAEVKIPWKIMRLPSPGERTLRFNVRRNVPRFQKTYFWRDVESGKIENLGRWVNVQVPRIQQERPLKLLPYAYAGLTDDETIFNSGLDFRKQIGDRIEAVGSINPDFRNIESDILSLDFSYFERLAGESRPFFQEGSEFFGTGYGARLFASQRVPEFDSGVKVFGNLDDRRKFGVMNLTSYGKQQANVASFTWNPTNRSNIDFAATSLRRKGTSNDGFFLNYGQSVGSQFSYVNAMATLDDAVGEGLRISAGISSGSPNRSWWLDAVSTEDTFRPRLGFASERNFKGAGGGISLTQNYETGALLETEVDFDGGYYWRQDGTPYRRSASASASITFRNGIDIDLGARLSRFEEFDDERYSASIEWPRRERYRRYEYTLVWGRLRGERYLAHNVSTAYRLLPTLQLTGGAQFLSHFEKETQIIAGANWEIGKDQSLSGRIVRQQNDWNAYFSFRRSGGLGTEYFLIVGDPNARSFRTSVILKVVSPIDIRF